MTAQKNIINLHTLLDKLVRSLILQVNLTFTNLSGLYITLRTIHTDRMHIWMNPYFFFRDSL